jgi:hypothetical protein
VLQRVDGHVRGQVVDAVQRLVGGERVRLRGGHADQQRPGEPRPGGDRDGVHIGQCDPGGCQRPVHRRHHRLQVRAARDLRHHAAEPGVFVHTGRHRVGEQGVPAHDADTRLVAGRLDAEDQRLHQSSRSMTSASVLLGW